MMGNLKAAISVAAEYSYHLHRDDGVPKDRAIAAGVSAVVRAARANREYDGRNARYLVPPRKPREAGVGFDASSLMGVGSLLSAVGWIRNLVTGA